MKSRAEADETNRIHIKLTDQNRKREKNTAVHVATEQSDKHYVLKKSKHYMKSLIGLKEIKDFIGELYAWVYINERRREAQLKTGHQNLHMIFKGNPGTGKTTVARLMGKMLKEMNVLSKGHLVEAERADLVGEYIGQTAQKTRDMVKKSMGGVLFIDEAYSLSRGGEKDFGKEAIDTLVKAMEDQQHDFVLILAGYPNEMDRFLSLNPGLPSRFPTVLTFPDFSLHELMQIFRNMLKERDYEWTPEAERVVKKHFSTCMNSDHSSFSNGRYVRNIVEKAIRHHAVRLLEEGREDDPVALKTLEAKDMIVENRQSR